MDLETECQSIYRNLLQARGVAIYQSATVFIRELENTKPCDHFHDFSKVRAAYSEKIGMESMRRITSYDETQKDERRAEQAVVHFYDWTQRCLVKALNWRSYIWYRTVYKVEYTAATLAVEGGVVGGWRYVHPWQRKWTQTPQPSSEVLSTD